MAVGLAPRDIFRLLAGDLVGVGGAPSACCPSHPTSPSSPPKPLLQELGGQDSGNPAGMPHKATCP